MTLEEHKALGEHCTGGTSTDKLMKKDELA